MLSGMDRQIVCFAIPTFRIAFARRLDSALQERPVAVALSLTPRSLIAEVSREASAEGVSVGMSVRQARHVCPALHVLMPDSLRLVQADLAIRQVVKRFAPVWEPVAPGQFFLDLTGTSRLFGFARDAAMRIERDVVRSHGLAGVAGIGSNKLVSRIASTLLDPMQLWDVRCGSESSFLAPLPVQVLPLGSASLKTVTACLDDLNIHTLGELAAVDSEALHCVLGREASRLQVWAHGIDSTPVRPSAEQPSIQATAICDPDDIDRDRLQARLFGLLEQVCGELRRWRRVCRRLTLFVETREAEHVTASCTIQPETSWEGELMPALRRLFTRTVRRRVRIRTLTVCVQDLAPVIEQLPFMEDKAHPLTRRRHLTLALDRIRERFGTDVIQWGNRYGGVRPSSRAF